jgi:hypothetical protein
MEFFECEGAPRDMGADQGRACTAELREQVGWLARMPWQTRSTAVRSALRDLQRYYPHQHEQLTGIARAARLPVSALAAASLRALNQSTWAMGYQQSGLARLVVRPPMDAVYRATRAEGRFAARELTRPVLTTALLAVNEAGLAAAVKGAPARGACAAPAALLVRDCVERFESVVAASEWCMTRPCAAGVTILLADAQGALAAVEIGADERRVHLPVDSVLFPGALPVWVRKIAKSLGESRFEAMLEEGFGAAVMADPTEKTLEAIGAELPATGGG